MRGSGRCAAHAATSLHSKIMAWVAVDRAIKAVERFGLEGPIERWRALRATIHAEVCQLSFSSERNAFVQYYGAGDLDAALLMIPLVGFLPASDPRVAGTVAAIERELHGRRLRPPLLDRIRGRWSAAGRGGVSSL